MPQFKVSKSLESTMLRCYSRFLLLTIDHHCQSR